MQEHHSKQDNIKIAVLLNDSFTILEVIGGLWSNSLTILSDALHDFGDSVTLISSWILEKKSQKKPDAKYTFGYQRLSLLSALLSSMILIGGSVFILLQTIPRLQNPEHVNSQGMILMAVVGIIFNGAGFLKLKKGSNMNEKVLSWHLLEDVLGWVVVLLGGTLIFFWDNHVIDPIMTIGFTIFILWGVTKNLKEVINIFFQATPSNISVDHIKEGLLAIKGVLRVHDVHVWSLEGETNIFTGHIVIEENLLDNSDRMKKEIKEELKKHQIKHSTIELESKYFCSGIECKQV